MTTLKRYAPGGFCWVELATSDQVAAYQFYNALFGWSRKDIPLPDGGCYTLGLRGDERIAGIYTLHDELRAKGVPSHWLSYVAVNDVDAAAAKAQSLGAKVFCEPMDVVQIGRMVTLQDPTGATFALWQEKRSPDEALPSEGAGICCWNELLTRDTPRAEQFYAALFGWAPKTDRFGDITYTLFNRGDRGIAGMLEIKPEWGPMPANWGVYFTVADCDERLATAKRLGAAEVAPAHDIPGVGRIAVLQDPQGAHFSILEPAPSAATP